MADGKMIQLGADSSQAFVLGDDGNREERLDLSKAVPVSPGSHGKVVARIGAPPSLSETALDPRSFKAELTSRRKVVMREIRRLKKFQTELNEIDRMLAAIKQPARSKG